MRDREAAISLVELMVVLVVVAVLAGVAAVAYSKYIDRARATEGVGNLKLIAVAQEAYYGEFARYADADAWNPASITCGRSAQWDGGEALWRSLGFAPENRTVYFQYQAVAGFAADSPPGWAEALIPADTRARGWYALEAKCDMDCSDSPVTQYRMVNTKADLIKVNEYR